MNFHQLVRQKWSYDEVEYVRNTARELRFEKRKIILKRKRQNPDYNDYDDSFSHEDYDLIATGLSILRAQDKSLPRRLPKHVENLLSSAENLLDMEDLSEEEFKTLEDTWAIRAKANENEKTNEVDSDEKPLSAKEQEGKGDTESQSKVDSENEAVKEETQQVVNLKSPESFGALLRAQWSVQEVNQLIICAQDILNGLRQGSLIDANASPEELAKGLNSKHFECIASQIKPSSANGANKSLDDVEQLIKTFPHVLTIQKPLADTEYESLVSSWRNLAGKYGDLSQPLGQAQSRSECPSPSPSSTRGNKKSLSLFVDAMDTETASIATEGKLSRPTTPVPVYKFPPRKLKKRKGKILEAEAILHQIECTNLGDVERLMEMARQKYEEQLTVARLERSMVKSLKKRKRFSNESTDQLAVDFYPSSKTSRRKKVTLTGSLDDMNQEEILDLGNTFRGRLVLKLVTALQGEFRQRCVYEWFYSSLDEDFFAHNEFEVCLENLSAQGISIGKWQKLSRCEWALIRKQMGKPRRLSAKFFEDERKRLNQYRKQAREIQMGASANSKNEKGVFFPYQVPVPLQVGMRVTAIHKGAKSLASGAILTINREENEYQVQFDIPRLGVMVCPDYAIRPSGPIEMLVTKSRSQSSKLYESRSGILDYYTGLRSSHGYHDQDDDSVDSEHSSCVENDENENGEEAKAAAETDRNGSRHLKSMSRLLKLLDRKEAIISEIRHMNSMVEVSGKKNGTDAKNIKAGYAWLLQLLEETNAGIEPITKVLRSSFLNNLLGPSSSAALNQIPKVIQEEKEENDTTRAPLSDWQAEFKRRWNKSAKLLTQQVYSAEVENESESKENGIEKVKPKLNELSPETLDMITNATSVLLAIRYCAEKGMSPSDVHMSLDASLDSLRPISAENSELFKEIQSSITLVKAGCIQGSPLL